MPCWGPNGSGKTTLFKAILGAVPYSGTIQTRPERLRVGHLIEYPAFYGRLSLAENLRLQADQLGADPAEIDELLDVVGLLSRRDLRFSGTSLGMRQRLGIARALLGRPHLLLLDEPTNGLDPAGIRDCRELLIRLRDERDIAIVVSSHNLTEVLAMADQLTFLQRGRVVHRTEPGRLTEQALEELYIQLMREEQG